MTIDLGPATERLGSLVRNVADEQLGEPTPCPDMSVADLLDHIGGLTLAFTGAAAKDVDGAGSQTPSADGSNLAADFRTRITTDLARLADAWRAPDAWTGMTRAGGVDLPGEQAGLVALDEVVIHGWDLARATGQPYDVDEPTLEAVHGFVSQFPTAAEERPAGLFGPVVDVPDDAPLLDRVLGLTGRDPNWSPA